jgi:hypothetical protein
MKNMKKASNNIIFKFTEEQKCIACQKGDNVVEQINYRTNAHYFQVLKAMHKKDLKDNLSFNDSMIFNNIFSEKRIFIK